MKRRKKPTEASAESAPAPLQPAYFDAGVPEPEPAPEAVEEQEPPSMEAAETEAMEAPAAGEQGEGGDGRPRRRRRRGRGGRGRNRSAAQPVANAVVPAPPSVEEAAPPAPTAAKPVQAAPAPVPARPPKGVVVLAIGLPGSGKSSWFKRHSITPLSSDLLRALLFDDATEQRFQDLVFSNLRSMLKARLIARRPMNYVDATNLTPHERHGWIKLAKDFGYEVQAVFFDVPVDVCLQRNQRRSRVVAEDVMRRMADKLKAPTFEEGFSKITVVKVKQKA
jgi:predicted kinase